MKTVLAAVCVFAVALGVQAGAPRQQGSAEAPAVAASDATQALAPDAAPAGGKINPQKAADIQRLMEVANMKSVLSKTMTAMETTMKAAMITLLPAGDYREQLADLFVEKFNSKLNLQQFLDIAATSFDKYLSDDDIKGLTRFYLTPLGQKTLTVLPKLTAEMQAQGMQIGQQLGKESMEEVLAEHPELAKALGDASRANSGAAHLGQN
ncbi:MAG: DUF2059 domain-containing protein [Candidatus Acidiferrales bacterium]